jgi:hypothetical protein
MWSGGGGAVKILRSQLGRIERLLDAVYCEPDPLQTVEQLGRFHHDDIPALSLEQLDAERILGRLRWAVLVHQRARPSAWLTERLAKLDAARASRTVPRSSRTTQPPHITRDYRRPA